MSDTASTPSVYLDTSALCRIFDDQSQSRVRLETEAVLVILEYIQAKMLIWIVSPGLIAEVTAISRAAERNALLEAIRIHGLQSEVDSRAVRLRMEQLRSNGVSRLDSFHVAYAELVRASFVTCDDRLARALSRIESPIWIGSPLAFCEEEFRR